MRLHNPQLAYTEAAVRGASSVELVIILYDLLLADLRRALEAFRGSGVERRTNELSHALRVVEQLQGSLAMEQGGEAAKQLDRFYDFTRAQILEAQLRACPATLQQLAEAISNVRSAWEELANPKVSMPSEAPEARFDGATQRADWTA